MKRYPCSWIRTINTVKMSILPKCYLSFDRDCVESMGQLRHNPCQNLNNTFDRKSKSITKIHMKSQKTLNSQAILQKKKKPGGTILPDFKLHYKITVIKAVWYLCKSNHIKQ